MHAWLVYHWGSEAREITSVLGNPFQRWHFELVFNIEIGY